MAVRPRGNSYQVDVKLGPTRYRETFKTRAEAEAWELEARAAHKLGKPIPRPRGTRDRRASIQTIQDLFERVDKKRWSGNPDCKSGDKGSADNALRFVRWVGPKCPVADALNEEKVEEFIEHREDEYGNSGSTINRYVAAISALKKEALKLKLIEDFDLPKRPEGNCRIRFFTEDEERLMFTVIRQWGYDDHLDLFTFLIDTGVRPGEAQKLRWEDVVGRSIILEKDITKNSTQRVLTATSRVMEALKRMKAKYQDAPGPFTWAKPRLRSTRTLWNRLRGHFDWMGKDTVIYTFRHTCASRLVQRGVDLYRVQIWMGHKSIQMTQRYAKFAPKHLAELADVLEPPEPPRPQLQVVGGTEV